MKPINILLILIILFAKSVTAQPRVVNNPYTGIKPGGLYETGDTLWGLFELEDRCLYLAQCQVKVEAWIDSSYEDPIEQKSLIINSLLPLPDGKFPKQAGSWDPVLFEGLKNPVAGKIDVVHTWGMNRRDLPFHPDSTFNLRLPNGNHYESVE